HEGASVDWARTWKASGAAKDGTKVPSRLEDLPTYDSPRLPSSGTMMPMPFVRGHFRRTPGGYSFVSPHYRRGSAGTSVLVYLALGLFGLIVFVVVTIVRAIMAHLREVIAVLVAVAVVAIVVFVVTELRKRRIHAYLDLCRDLATDGILEPERLKKIEVLAAKLPVDSQVRQLEEEAIYRDLIARILADDRIDDQERRVLRHLENAFV